MSTAFADALKKEVDGEKTESENGAVMYRTSSNKLVDCNFALSSFRQKTEDEIVKAFSDAYYENKEYALRWLFMARDVREGSGERRTFRVLLKWLATVDPALAGRLVPAAAEYGRFDDLFCLLGTGAEDAVFSLVKERLEKDLAAAKEGRPASLLAKWLKSPNTSSAASRAVAKKTYRALGMTEKEYRKALSALRSYLDVVEVKMSAGRWGEIEYGRVPSKANLAYAGAFMKNDQARRARYLESLKKGEAKINAGACFPSDIAYQYMKAGLFGGPAQHLESMWKALPDMGGEAGVITVVDVSGSMTWTTCDPASGIRPIDVALALGVYCSERLVGPFKDKAITFSARPEYVDMSGAGTLYEKLGILQRSAVAMNTDVKAVMDLLLRTAKNAGLRQEDVPAVAILSDMEFDAGCGRPGEALFDEIAREWKEAGYSLPKIYFWNLGSRTGGIPIQFNENGVGLVSGYSQNTVRMLLSGRLDPWGILKEQLDAPRYARISEIAGGLADAAA